MDEKITGSLKELDEVFIPQEVSDLEGVELRGTIVWYIDGASYATIECAVRGGTGVGDETKLLDIDVNSIRKVL